MTDSGSSEGFLANNLKIVTLTRTSKTHCHQDHLSLVSTRAVFPPASRNPIRMAHIQHTALQPGSHHLHPGVYSPYVPRPNQLPFPMHPHPFPLQIPRFLRSGAQHHHTKAKPTIPGMTTSILRRNSNQLTLIKSSIMSGRLQL